MKRIFGLLVLMWWMMASWCQAAGELTETMVRLSRNQANISPLPVLVTFKTESEAIENGLKIRVGSGWVVGSIGQITVSITNLPTGVVPITGITIRSVNGHEMEFDINDLAAGTNYAFYLTGGIGINPEAGGDMGYKWLVSTMIGSNIDFQKEIKVAVVDSDQLTITGRVVPKTTDFQLNIEASPTGVLKQEEEIEITIKYGSYLKSLTKPLRIRASWSQGTVAGAPQPTVDLLDYVSGSANDAYGGNLPVIDILNRQIEWTISTYPAERINEEVSFKLITTDNYTGSSQVNFEVTAILEAAEVLSISEELSGGYQYYSSTIPTPTPTSVSQSTSTTSTSSTPTSTPSLSLVIEEKIKINKIDINSLSDKQVGINVLTNKVWEKMKIRYGESIGFLNKSVNLINNDFRRSGSFQIDGLKPNTNYFFRIDISDEKTNLVSEVYTFKTTEFLTVVELKKESLLVLANETIILDARDEEGENLIVLPTNEVYSVKINLENAKNLSDIKIIVRPSQVLGIMSVNAVEPAWGSADLNLLAKKGFIGQLLTPQDIGFFEVFFRIKDIYGNIVEEKLADLKTVRPMTVRDSKGENMEGAKVMIYKYNQLKNIFEEIPAFFQGINNPSYVESNGELKLSLPKGKYRIEVSNWGYQTETIDFDIGAGIEEKYPEVVLRKKSMSITDFGQMIGESVSRLGIYVKKIMIDIGSSGRMLKMALMTQLFFSVGILLVFRWRHLKKKINFWKFWPLGMKIVVREILEVIIGLSVVILSIGSLLFLRYYKSDDVWLLLLISVGNLICWFYLIFVIEKSGEEKN